MRINYEKSENQSSLFNNDPPFAEDFQSRGVREGRSFAALCKKGLTDVGFLLYGPFPIEQAGCCIEQRGINKVGQEFFFEITGCFNSERPGLQRTDSVKKIISNAYSLQKHYPGSRLIVLTSHCPIPESSSDKIIRDADRLLWDVLCIYIEEDIEQLRRCAGGVPAPDDSLPITS